MTSPFSTFHAFNTLQFHLGEWNVNKKNQTHINNYNTVNTKLKQVLGNLAGNVKNLRKGQNCVLNTPLKMAQERKWVIQKLQNLIFFYCGFSDEDKAL